MKKQYQTPALDTFCLEPGAYLETVTMSIGEGTTPTELDSKSRYGAEDEEAYAVTGGEGEASYGDLW